MGGGKSGGGGRAPAAPDYNAVAKTQGAEDRKTAELLTKSNRPTQINDQGSITWQQDANGNWTQVESSSPDIKAARDAYMARQKELAGGIQNQGDFQGAAQVDWNPNAQKEYGDAIYKSIMDRAAPQQAHEMDMFATRLRQQGLQPGTPAYDRAMQNLMTSQGDVNTQAAQQATIEAMDQYRQDYQAQLQGQDQNYSQDLQNYQMPWDLANASQGLVANSRPSFAGFGTSTGYNAPDLAGAAQKTYEAKMGQYNAKQSGGKK